MVDIVHKKDAKTLFAGGGGGASYPTVISDNLVSGDWLEALIGLCEGPI